VAEPAEHFAILLDVLEAGRPGVSLTDTADGKWEAKHEGKVFLEGTVKLDPLKKPKAADWIITTEGDLKGKTTLGTYDVDKGYVEALLRVRQAAGEVRVERGQQDHLCRARSREEVTARRVQRRCFLGLTCGV
jgi:hypothetical protein